MIGLRELEKDGSEEEDTTEEDDDEEKFTFEVLAVPTKKNITINESIIIIGIFISIMLYCMKCNICPTSWEAVSTKLDPAKEKQKSEDLKANESEEEEETENDEADDTGLGELHTNRIHTIKEELELLAKSKYVNLNKEKLARDNVNIFSTDKPEKDTNMLSDFLSNDNDDRRSNRNQNNLNDLDSKLRETQAENEKRQAEIENLEIELRELK